MWFQTRAQAAEALATKLAPFAGLHPIVVALPPCGVVIAAIIAEKLSADFGVLSKCHCDTSTRPEGIDRALHTCEYERMMAWQERTQREELLDVRGRTVIVVDDGAATGQMMVSALRYLKGCGAAKVIAALPLASNPAAKHLENEADELVLLQIPLIFPSVSSFYLEDRCTPEPVTPPSA